MSRKVRFHITIVFLAVYLAETLVMGFAHRRGCASSPLASCSRQQVAAHGACDGDRAHRCCSSGADAESKPAEDAQPPLVPCNDEDDCSICRHLAQRPLCEDAVCEPLSGELVEFVQPVELVLDIVDARLAHRPRGPPASTW